MQIEFRAISVPDDKQPKNFAARTIVDPETGRVAFHVNSDDLPKPVTLHVVPTPYGIMLTSPETIALAQGEDFVLIVNTEDVAATSALFAKLSEDIALVQDMGETVRAAEAILKEDPDIAG